MKRLMLNILFVACCSVALAQRYPTHIPCFRGDKWGYCDSNGKWLLQPDWDKVDMFVGERAMVYRKVKDSSNPQRVYMRTVAGIINKRGKYIIPLSRGWNGTKSIGMFNVTDLATGKQGIIDSNNKVVVPVQYDWHSDSKWIYDRKSKSQFFMGMREGKWGMIDERRRTVIPFEYHWFRLDDTASMVFRAGYKGKQTAIDLHNRTVVPLADEVYYQWNTWIAKNGDKWGTYDSVGKLVVPIRYNFVMAGPDTIVGYNSDTTYTYMDKQGKVLRVAKEFTYHSPSRFDYLGGRPCGYRELIDPTTQILYRGERINQVKVDGEDYYTVLNLNRHSFDGLEEPLYVAKAGRMYSNYPREQNAIIVDTALKRRSAVFKGINITGMIGSYVVGSTGNRSALFDTNATMLTQPMNVWMQGYVANKKSKSSEDSLLIIVTPVVEYGPIYDLDWEAEYNPCNRWNRRMGRTGDSVVNSAGKPMKQFEGYRSFRYITAEEKRLLGRDDILFATDAEGREGIIDVEGKVVFPAVSFKYKFMDVVGQKSHWGLGGTGSISYLKKPLLSAPGSFIVHDDSGRVGYFYSNGSALVPALNFRYPHEARKMGDNLFWLSAKHQQATTQDDEFGLKAVCRDLLSQPSLKLVNRENKDMMPYWDVKGVDPVAAWPGLYLVTVQKGKGQDWFSFYMSEDGRVYGEINQ